MSVDGSDSPAGLRTLEGLAAGRLGPHVPQLPQGVTRTICLLGVCWNRIKPNTFTAERARGERQLPARKRWAVECWEHRLMPAAVGLTETLGEHLLVWVCGPLSSQTTGHPQAGLGWGNFSGALVLWYPDLTSQMA